MRYLSLKKRRFWLIAIILLMAFSTSFLIIKKQDFLDRFKTYLQKKIAKDLGIDIEIAEIKGGFIWPFTFKGINISTSKDDQGTVFFKTNATLRNYRIWDLALAQIFGYKELVLMLDEGQLYLGSQKAVLSQIEGQVTLTSGQIKKINLIADYKFGKVSLAGQIKGRQAVPELDLKLIFVKQFTKTVLSLAGSLKNPQLEGTIFLLDDRKVNFASTLVISEDQIIFEDANFNQLYLAQGSYDIRNNKFSAKIFAPDSTEKTLTIDFGFDNETPENKITAIPFFLKLNFNHFDVFGRDVISSLDVKGKLANGGKHKKNLTVTLSTMGTIINHRPAEEMKAIFSYEDNALEIISAQVGDKHTLRGLIDFKEESPNIDVVWQLIDMDVSDLALLSNGGNGNEKSHLSGKLNGDISIGGNLLSPLLKVALQTQGGNLGNIAFKNANVNLEGCYPVLDFHDSRIYREEGGFFILDGRVDLRRVGQPLFFNDILVLGDDKTVVLDGWDIMRGTEKSELTLKKAISDDLKVGFKTFVNDKMQDIANESDFLELEYRLQGNRSLFMRFEKDEECFGLKHDLRF